MNDKPELPPSPGEVVWNSALKHPAYVAVVLLLSYVTGSYRLLVAATSFCHYVLYIYTYYDRSIGKDKTKRQYKAFQKTVLMYKTLALCHLAYIYLRPIFTGAEAVDHLSLLLIVLGYLVSMAATHALGVEGTYFAIELGFLEADYNFVKAFPYNVFPHPMILGQVVGLLGMYKVAHVRAGWPWLIPVHVALYLTHMVQEIYDVHRGPPWYKNHKKRV